MNFANRATGIAPLARFSFGGGVKKWRQASLPAVEGGILPPGNSLANRDAPYLQRPVCCHANPPGWKPRLYVSQDGRRYILKPALSRIFAINFGVEQASGLCSRASSPTGAHPKAFPCCVNGLNARRPGSEARTHRLEACSTRIPNASFRFSRVRAANPKPACATAGRKAFLHFAGGWKLLASFLLLATAFVLTGCFRAEPPADVTICNANEPESLDPHIVTGVSEMRITKALFDGLMKLDATNAAPIPALAERWEISDDGRTYTFHLRSNAVWSTGEPITSADVVWSWFRAVNPATAGDYAGQLFYLKGAEDWYNGKLKDPAEVGIRALDERRVQVELNAPLAFFLDLCAAPAFAVVPRQTIEKYGDRWLHARPLPTSGAFTLEAWRVNDKVRLRRNPRYWDAAHTASEIIDVLPTGSPNTALNLYETGVADIIWDKDLIPTELMDVLGTRPDFHTFAYLGTYFYRFNVTKPPFHDARVRLAFARATDKERLITKLTKGAERAAAHFVPVGVANYQSTPAAGFDPDAARRLLAAAGFPGGRGFPRITYTFFSAAGGGAKVHGKVGVELQQMWREVLGVEVELRQIERKVFYAAQSKLDYDISTSSWIGDYNDANTFLDLFLGSSGNNRTGWKHPQYDALIHEANLATDRARRADLFRAAETILVAEEAPIVPLYFYAGINCYDERKLGGIWPNILDEHPMQYLYKKGRGTKVESPGPDTGARMTLDRRGITKIND